MRLIDADELIKKAIPKNPEAKFRCVGVNDIVNAPTIETQPDHIAEVSKKGDMISRADAIDAMMRLQVEDDEAYGCHIPEGFDGERAKETLEQLPSAEPKQRYTEEELSVFAHGISLSLLSKRSAQYWRYDEDTATEIKFLERLYEKVVADMGRRTDE